MVLDNARYQRCRLVQDMAHAMNIELLFLPSYSPNLNLIERFWLFLKKKALWNRYYPTFADFRDAIRNVFNTLGSFKDELASLLTPNFHTIGVQTAGIPQA